MLPKPEWFGAQYAAAFQEPGVAVEAAQAFDAEARRLVSAYTTHTAELQLVAEITWGIPLRPEAA